MFGYFIQEDTMRMEEINWTTPHLGIRDMGMLSARIWMVGTAHLGTSFKKNTFGTELDAQHFASLTLEIKSRFLAGDASCQGYFTAPFTDESPRYALKHDADGQQALTDVNILALEGGDTNPGYNLFLLNRMWPAGFTITMASGQQFDATSPSACTCGT